MANVKSRRGFAHSFPRSARRGLSLTEVLISLGLMTVGLLGVLLLFPAGTIYLRQAETADRASAIGRSVMSDILARGMLDANSWRMVSAAPAVPTVDGLANAYTRPVAPAIEAWKIAGATTWDLAKRAGNIYVLDPMAVAVTTTPAAALQNKIVAAFPAEANLIPAATYSSCSAWQPWLGGSDYWPVRRVTLTQALPLVAGKPKRMEAPLAWSLFSGNSDLAFDHPPSDDQPAMQFVGWSDRDGDKQPDLDEWIARQSTGDYSWLVTIAPSTNDARNNLTSGAYNYVVSVVVFYKRGLSPKAPTSSAEALSEVNALFNRERMVKARIVSTSPNGGEVIVEAVNTGVPNPFADLRSGRWVMICGPKPIMETVPTPEPRFTAGWYEVQAVDSDGIGIAGFNPAIHRLVTLRGPEWPWLPQAGANDLSNNLCVGVFPSAVAVHTKTLRLQQN